MTGRIAVDQGRGFAGEPIIRIHAQAPRSQSWDITDLWWVGPCPWPSMPGGGSADFAVASLHSWRCCPDTGPVGSITDVEVHLPRTEMDFAFTVSVDYDPDDMPHLAEVHGFDQG